MDFKKRIISDIKCAILIEGKKLVIPYPNKEDTEAKSLEDFNKISGFDTLLRTVNNKEHMILKTAALNHALTLLTDRQLYDLLVYCLEGE